jgi:hypothetical protein
MAYHIAQMALQNQPNVTFDIPESWYSNYRIYGYNFLALHGEDILSYVGFPWYGATRSARNYVAMFRRAEKRLIRDRQPKTVAELEACSIVPDYVLIAHFHSEAQWEAADVEHFANGTMAGVSYYGAKRRMVISRPKQTVLFVHPKYGIGMQCSIDLDEIGGN